MNKLNIETLYNMLQIFGIRDEIIRVMQSGNDREGYEFETDDLILSISSNIMGLTSLDEDFEVEIAYEGIILSKLGEAGVEYCNFSFDSTLEDYTSVLKDYPLLSRLDFPDIQLLKRIYWTYKPYMNK